MASLNAQLNILWDEALASNNELNLFIKKLEENNVKQFLDADIVRFNAEVCIYKFLVKTNKIIQTTV